MADEIAEKEAKGEKRRTCVFDAGLSF